MKNERPNGERSENATATQIVGSPQDALLNALLESQESRWLEGERVSIELLLSSAPSIANDSILRREWALSLICNEVLLREQIGEQPRLEEYTVQFPELAIMLEIQWEVNQLVKDEIDEDASTIADSNVFPRGVRTSSYVGSYRLLKEIGRGAAGIVYEAWHDALKRSVAIKVLRGEHKAESQEMARFRHEAEAIARIQHPNIIQIYDVGVTDGTPFFAMELCRGGSLAERIKGHSLTTLQIARLMLDVARGIQEAHRNHIIHRDLKPSNILLVQSDQWVPRISDFGLAKSIDCESMATQTGGLLGTPAYMSPKQAIGKAKHSGVAADIFSLGAILYELLTKLPPFRGKTIVETLDQVQRMDPIPPRRIEPSIPVDLEVIALKCLNKHPSYRYADAAALIEDLERFLDRRPIRARPASAFDKTRSWCVRNPSVAGLLCVVLVLVLGSIVGLIAFNHWIRSESNEKSQALLQRELALEQYAEAMGFAVRNEALSRERYYAAQINLAGQAFLGYDPTRVEDLLLSVLPRQGEDDLRGFEWYYLNRAIRENLSFSMWAGKGEVASMRFSASGDKLLICGGDQNSGYWKLLDASTGETLLGSSDSNLIINGCAISPDDSHIVLAHGSGEVQIWNNSDRRQVYASQFTSPLKSTAWSPDGRWIALGNEDGAISLLRFPEGAITTIENAHRGPVLRLFFSPDSSYLFSSVDWGDEGMISKKWKIDNDRLHLAQSHPETSVSDLSADQTTLVGMHWGNLKLVDSTNGDVQNERLITSGPLVAVNFTDGNTLFLASRNDRVVYELDSGTLEITNAIPVRNTISALALDRSNKLVAVGDSKGEIRVWKVRQTQIGDRAKIQFIDSHNRWAAFEGTGCNVLLGGSQPTQRWFPAEDRRKVYHAPPDACAFAIKSKHLVCCHLNDQGGQTIEIWDASHSNRKTIELSTLILKSALQSRRTGHG